MARMLLLFNCMIVGVVCNGYYMDTGILTPSGLRANVKYWPYAERSWQRSTIIEHNSNTPMSHSVRQNPMPRTEPKTLREARALTSNVILKKKERKKRKILTTYSGVFVRGGTRLIGKFKTLHDCQKSCEIIPSCFAGDFNIWLQACYHHTNFTACGTLDSHKSIIHFKKVVCDVPVAQRGIVVLGAAVPLGIELPNVDTLTECIKRCVTAGGGVASSVVNMVAEGQICCGINYDFATHKCYVHPCPTFPFFTFLRWCGLTVSTPLNAIPDPNVVTITFCPDTTFP